MFSFFSKNKKVIGLDITEDRIRYVEVLIKGDKKSIISYGEERVANVEPRNALMSTLSGIKRKRKVLNAVVSLPADIVRFENVSIYNTDSLEVFDAINFKLVEENRLSSKESVLFYEKLAYSEKQTTYNVAVSSPENIAFFKSVFKNSDINILRFVSRKEALVKSCIKEGNLIPTMIVNAEVSFTDFVIFDSFNQTKEVNLNVPKENIPEVLKELYLDFYKKNNQKIGYIFACGSLVKEPSFINYLGTHTRLPVEEADVFVNLNLEKGEIPTITKEESFSYAVALGLALS